MASDDIDPDAPLAKQPYRSRQVLMPDAVSDRLDELCRVVNAEGSLTGTVHRKHLGSALIALAPEDPAALQRLLAEYQDMKVRDAQVAAGKDAKVVKLRAVRPGRRPA